MRKSFNDAWKRKKNQKKNHVKIIKKNNEIDKNEKKWDERKIEKIKREKDKTRAKINILRFFDVSSFRFFIQLIFFKRMRNTRKRWRK